jgi:hypothetical protein
LTDLNLLELKEKHPYEVITETITRPKEGKIGADWEWWFTGPSKLWLGFRVQAKVININSNEYEHLYYSKKDKNNKIVYQYDLLIDSALKAKNSRRLIPLYCLYSNWSGEKIDLSWPCETFKRNVRSYGCSVMSAFAVKYLNLKSSGTDKDIRSLLPYMRPWQCLICCDAYGIGDLPQRALSFWKNNVKASENQIMSQLEPGLQADIIGGQSEIMGFYNNIELIQNPPDYVGRILQRLPIETIDEAVDRVTIIREAEQP